MKRIFKNNSNFVVTEISEGFDSRDFEPKKTHLEVSKANDKESQKDFIFYQETVPNCEQKYWKIESGFVAEMSEAEKLEVDAKEFSLTEFKDKLIKLHIPSYSNLLAAGFTNKALVIDKNDSVIKEPSNDGDTIDLYMNSIYPQYVEDVDNAIAAGLIVRTDNHYLEGITANVTIIE